MVNNNIFLDFIGSKIRYQEWKSSQESCSEWTPASQLEHNPSLGFPSTLVLANKLLICFVCFFCDFPLGGKSKSCEVQQYHWSCGTVHVVTTLSTGFFLRHSAKVHSPSTKCENDVCITKAFSQHGRAVIWNKLIFSWEGSKSLEVLFF